MDPATLTGDQLELVQRALEILSTCSAWTTHNDLVRVKERIEEEAPQCSPRQGAGATTGEKERDPTHSRGERCRASIWSDALSGPG